MGRHSEDYGCLVWPIILLLIFSGTAIKKNPILIIYIVIFVIVISLIFWIYNIFQKKVNDNKLILTKNIDLEKKIETLQNQKQEVQQKISKLQNKINEIDLFNYEIKAKYNELFIKNNSLIDDNNKLKNLVSGKYNFLLNNNDIKKNDFLKDEINEIYKDLKILVNDKDSLIKDLIFQLKQKDIHLESFLNKKFDDDFFDRISSIKSDFLVSEFKETEEFLKKKKHPAFKKAEDIKTLRQKTKVILEDYNFLKYKYELLYTVFPELENYFDNLEDILNFRHKSLSEAKENYDYAKDYLSKEEYEKLNETERNQLALDRYINKNSKTDWQVGRDYELMVGQIFEKEGCTVEYIGMEKKLNDLGRDLIAHKNNITLIIQCKMWSEKKTIREKHIAQLFGTTKMYEFENEKTLLDTKVKSVFITTTDLSETALEFANKLNVKIKKIKFKEFPRIKCNINNNGDKIYHLPFDQQYDKTKINKQGEFYALTIKEAEEMGFRRALRFYNKNSN